MADIYLFLNNECEWQISDSEPNELLQNSFVTQRGLLDTLEEVGPGRGIEVDSEIQNKLLKSIRNCLGEIDINISEFNPPSSIKLTGRDCDNLQDGQKKMIVRIIQEVEL